ncbi:MAG: hypothetical protein H7838_03120 [Magnetococcus sp. DMHC-8]
MKTGILSLVRPGRLAGLVPLVGLVLGWPAPLPADPLLGIGILGGALVGSLVGVAHYRGQNGLLGGAPGGMPAQATIDTTQRTVRPTEYPALPPATGTVVQLGSESLECRSMQTQGFVNGRMENLVGMACRSNGAGEWQFRGPPRLAAYTVTTPTPSIVTAPAQAPTVAVYPALTTTAEPLPALYPSPVTEETPYGGRYYGHRDYWQNRYSSHVSW